MKMGAAVDAPARQSFVIEMVGADDVSNAVGLNSASFNLGRVIGPALAGFLIVLFGTGPVFLINAASYIAVILALRAMRVADLQSAPRMQRGKGQVREGIRYVRRRPDLMLVMVIIFFVGTFGLNFQMTSALMATEVFGKGATEYGHKVIEIARANTNAAFDFMESLFGVKSASEMVELSTSHVRKQFETMSAQSKELTALAQKVTTETVEPIKESVSSAFKKVA